MDKKNNVYSADYAYLQNESGQFMNIVVELYTDGITIDLVIVTDHTIANEDLEEVLTELKNNKLKKMRLKIEDVIIYVHENGVRNGIDITVDGESVKVKA